MEGRKDDQGKNRLELIPTELILEVGKVLTFGAQKYEANNWRNFKKEDHPRLIGAMMRHLEAYRSGEKTDPESGLPHLAHVATNCGFLLALQDQSTAEYAGSKAENHEYVDVSVNEYMKCVELLVTHFENLYSDQRVLYQIVYIPHGGYAPANDLGILLNEKGWSIDVSEYEPDTEYGKYTVIVDDIVDTGKTIQNLPAKLPIFTVVKRHSANVSDRRVLSGKTIEHDKYIRFPWERKDD